MGTAAAGLVAALVLTYLGCGDSAAPRARSLTPTAHPTAPAIEDFGTLRRMDWLLRLLWQEQEDRRTREEPYLPLGEAGLEWARRALRDETGPDPIEGARIVRDGPVERVTLADVTLTFALDSRAGRDPGWWCLATPAEGASGPSAFAAAGGDHCVAWATRRRAGVVDVASHAVRLPYERGPESRVVLVPTLDPPIPRTDLWRGSRTLCGEYLEEAKAEWERRNAEQDVRRK